MAVAEINLMDGWIDGCFMKIFYSPYMVDNITWWVCQNEGDACGIGHAAGGTFVSLIAWRMKET